MTLLCSKLGSYKTRIRKGVKRESRGNVEIKTKERENESLNVGVSRDVR